MKKIIRNKRMSNEKGKYYEYNVYYKDNNP